MNILVTSLQPAGIGRSSIAQSLAIYLDGTCVTSDRPSGSNSSSIHLTPEEETIPEHYFDIDPVVFDLSIGTTPLPAKNITAANRSSTIVIPTLVTKDSLQATVETYQLLEPFGKPILIVINNIPSWKDYRDAEEYLCNTLDNPLISSLRRSSLLQRMIKSGIWEFQNLAQIPGGFRLSHLKSLAEDLFDYITELGDPNANKPRHQRYRKTEITQKENQNQLLPC